MLSTAIRTTTPSALSAIPLATETMSASEAPSQTPTLLEEHPATHEETHREHVASTIDVQRAEEEFHRLEQSSLLLSVIITLQRPLPDRIKRQTM